MVFHHSQTIQAKKMQVRTLLSLIWSRSERHPRKNLECKMHTRRCKSWGLQSLCWSVRRTFVTLVLSRHPNVSLSRLMEVTQSSKTSWRSHRRTQVRWQTSWRLTVCSLTCKVRPIQSQLQQWLSRLLLSWWVQMMLTLLRMEIGKSVPMVVCSMLQTAHRIWWELTWSISHPLCRVMTSCLVIRTVWRQVRWTRGYQDVKDQTINW